MIERCDYYEPSAAIKREARSEAGLFRPSEAKDGLCRAYTDVFTASLKRPASLRAYHNTKQRGFTLIELLVSLVLFAVLMTSSFQLFDSVLNANERSREQLQQQNQLSMAWTIIFQDLIQLRARTHRDIRGDQQSAYETSQDELARFIRAGLPPIQGVTPGGMQRVAYQFEDSTLYRLSWPVLDLAADSEPSKQVLFKDLKAVTFEHLDNNNIYREDWPPAGSPVGNTMPRMIRISIVFKDNREMQRIFPGIST